MKHSYTNKEYMIYDGKSWFDFSFGDRYKWLIDLHGNIVLRTPNKYQKYILPIFEYLATNEEKDNFQFVYLDGDQTNLQVSNLMRINEFLELDYKAMYPNAVTWTNHPVNEEFLEVWARSFSRRFGLGKNNLKRGQANSGCLPSRPVSKNRRQEIMNVFIHKGLPKDKLATSKMPVFRESYDIGDDLHDIFYFRV